MLFGCVCVCLPDNKKALNSHVMCLLMEADYQNNICSNYSGVVHLFTCLLSWLFVRIVERVQVCSVFTGQPWTSDTDMCAICSEFILIKLLCKTKLDNKQKQSKATHTHTHTLTGVALTFEKLRIANAQHGKNCVSSPAARATISTDLPKIVKHENTNV